MLGDEDVDFVLLDELNIALVKEYVGVEQVLAEIAATPMAQTDLKSVGEGSSLYDRGGILFECEILLLD